MASNQAKSRRAQSRKASRKAQSEKAQSRTAQSENHARPARPPSTAGKGSSSPSTPDDRSLELRASRLEEEFRRLYADLIARKQVSGAIARDREPPAMELRLKVSANGKPVRNAPSLFDQLVGSVEDLTRREAAFPRGHVYCHRCRTFTCEHSRPRDSRHVFAGYAQTGEPSWREFASILLERRDPRIDLLYRPQPSPVTLLQDAKELTRQQLAVYGKWSTSFQILGQVALGYLPVGQNGNRVSVAMCFQAVQTGGGTGPLVLNVVGTIPDQGPVVEFLESQPDPRVSNALLATRRCLGDLALLECPRRRRSAILRGKASTILQRLSRNLERIYRQRQRRTRHSQVRHLDRRRPAATAFRDALRADEESIFRDVEEGTWVVIGPKNRVHVFNDGALHVTSVVYQGETIRQRTRRGKWRTPKSGELSGFKESLRRVGHES